MCLVVKSGPHVARKDIVVWKRVIPTSSLFDKLENKFALAPYMQFTYRQFTLYSTGIHIFPERYGMGRVISNGFHSYAELSTAKATVNAFTEKVAAFVIPKGAVYYRGKHGDMVSNKIVSGSLHRDHLIEE